MARKREKLQDINTPEYWDQVLTNAGLSTERGRSSRLHYIGASADIERLEGYLKTDDGRTPKEKTE